MKTVLRFIIIACIASSIWACGERPEANPSLPPVAVSTGELDTSTLTIIGEITELGDGIEQHGHVWSDDEPEPTVEEGILEGLGALDMPASFTSQIVLPDESRKYFVRAYAIDVHDCVHYGEDVVEITPPNLDCNADFLIENNNCLAPCEIRFSENVTGAFAFRWDFGDESSISSASNPVHLYPKPGIYEVKLTISSNGTVCDSTTKQVNIAGITFDTTITNLGPIKSIKALKSGDGYIATGAVSGGDGIYFIRLDINGDVISGFPKTYSNSDSDTAEDIIELSDGTIVIVGSTFNQSSGNRDVLFLRTSPTGTEILGPTTLGTTDWNDYAHSVIEDEDSGFLVIAGYSEDPLFFSTDLYVLKVSKELNVFDFDNKITLPGEEIGFDIVELPEGYGIVGSISPSGFTASPNAMYARINDLGVLSQPIVEYGDTGIDDAASIIRTPANELVFCGVWSSGGTSGADIFLTKTTLDGTPVSPFPKVIGMGGIDRGYEVSPLMDGGFMIAGQRETDALLLTVDSSGEIMLNTSYNIGGGQAFFSGFQTPDCGYVLAGTNNNSLFIVKTDHLGAF